MSRELLLSDLTRCEPSEAISDDGRPGTWMAVDYGLEDGEGKMIFALPGADAPPLTLRLGVQGWYEIRFGVYYGTGPGALEDRFVCAKLTDDHAYSRFSSELCGAKDGEFPEKVLTWLSIAEAFWKCADLTGQDLIIAHPPRGHRATQESNLAYVRLTPMDDEAIDAWHSEQPAEDTRILLANYGGCGNIMQWGLQTWEDYLAEFECLRDSDFDVALYTAAYGPITFYPSQVGELVRREHDCWNMGDTFIIPLRTDWIR